MDKKPKKNRQDEALSQDKSTSSEKPAEPESSEELENTKAGKAGSSSAARPDNANEAAGDELMDILAGEDIDKLLAENEAELLGNAAEAEEIAKNPVLDELATSDIDQDSDSAEAADADDELENYEADYNDIDVESIEIDAAVTTEQNSEADSPQPQSTSEPAPRTDNQVEIDAILHKHEDGEFSGFEMGMFSADESEDEPGAPAASEQAANADITEALTSEEADGDAADTPEQPTRNNRKEHTPLSSEDIEELFYQSAEDDAQPATEVGSLSVDELDELFGKAIPDEEVKPSAISDSEVIADTNEQSALLEEQDIQFDNKETQPEQTRQEITEAQDLSDTQLQADTSAESSDAQIEQPPVSTDQTEVVTDIAATTEADQDDIIDGPTVIGMNSELADSIIASAHNTEDADDESISADDIEQMINESVIDREKLAAGSNSSQLDDIESMAAMAADGISEDSSDNTNFMSMSELDDLFGRTPDTGMSRPASTLSDDEIESYSSKYGAEVASLDDLDDLFGKSKAQPSAQHQPQSSSQADVDISEPQEPLTQAGTDGSAAPPDSSNDEFTGEITTITQDELDKLFDSFDSEQDDKEPSKADPGEQPSDVSEALSQNELDKLLNASANVANGKHNPEPEPQTPPPGDQETPSLGVVSQDELDELLNSYNNDEQQPETKPDAQAPATSDQEAPSLGIVSQDDLDELFAQAAPMQQPESLAKPQIKDKISEVENARPKESAVLSQDDLDALFEQAAGGGGVTPADEQSEAKGSAADGAKPLSQDDLDELFAQASGDNNKVAAPQAEQPPAQETAADDSQSLSQDELDKLFAQAGGDDGDAAEPAADDSQSLSQDELDKLFAQAGGDNVEAAEPQPEQPQNQEPSADDSGGPLNQSELDALFEQAGAGESDSPPEDDWDSAPQEATASTPENLDELISESIDKSEIVSEEQELQDILKDQQKSTDEVSENEIDIPETETAAAEAKALLSDEPEPVGLPVANFEDLQTLLDHRDKHGLPSDPEEKEKLEQEAKAQKAADKVPLKLRAYRMVCKINSPFEKMPDSAKEYATYAAIALISAGLMLMMAAQIRS